MIDHLDLDSNNDRVSGKQYALSIPTGPSKEVRSAESDISNVQIQWQVCKELYMTLSQSAAQRHKDLTLFRWPVGRGRILAFDHRKRETRSFPVYPLKAEVMNIDP